MKKQKLVLLIIIVILLLSSIIYFINSNKNISLDKIFVETDIQSVQMQTIQKKIILNKEKTNELIDLIKSNSKITFFKGPSPKGQSSLDIIFKDSSIAEIYDLPEGFLYFKNGKRYLFQQPLFEDFIKSILGITT